MPKSHAPLRHCRLLRISRVVVTVMLLTAMTAVAIALPATATARGGVGAYPGLPVDAADTGCTIGMTGHIGPARYAVTAGHCFSHIDGGQVTDNFGNPLGWYEQGVADDNVHSIFGYSLIRLWESVFPATNIGRIDITSLETSPVVGESICKAGATTGWTCGSITEVHPGRLVSDIPGAKGDSGGVIYHQTAAGQAAFVGILEGVSATGYTQIDPVTYLDAMIQQRASTAFDKFEWYGTS